MGIIDAVDRYFDAWNAHDPDAVLGSLTPGGTYEDPTTGGPLAGDALAANVAGLVAGFPDVSFEIVSCAPISERAAAARWVMHGTNTGPMPGGPPTGGTIALPGADFLDYDPASDRIEKVVGYFDTATMLRQLGLQAHVTPADLEPVRAFGWAARIDSGRDAQPGALSLTWIEIDHEHDAHLTASTQAIVIEQLGAEAGYLGSMFAVVGRRHYTVTAWTEPDAARKALRGGKHGEAMRDARAGGFGENARGVTSIWKPEVLNGVFRPGTAGSLDLSELTGQWL